VSLVAAALLRANFQASRVLIRSTQKEEMLFYLRENEFYSFRTYLRGNTNRIQSANKPLWTLDDQWESYTERTEIYANVKIYVDSNFKGSWKGIATAYYWEGAF